MSNFENIIPPLLQDWAAKLNDPKTALHIKENYRNMFSFIRDFSAKQVEQYDKELANIQKVKAAKKR